MQTAYIVESDSGYYLRGNTLTTEHTRATKFASQRAASDAICPACVKSKKAAAQKGWRILPA